MLLAVAVLPVSGPTKVATAAPFAACDTNGFLFKYPGGPTDVHTVDMVTGEDSLVAPITGRQINAIGYNPKDNFIYGWDDQNDTFVRVHGDHTTVDPLTISGYGGPTSGIIIGDVDDNGHYWFLNAAETTWYQIDLTTPTPTFIDSASPGANPTGSAGADWAFVPGTDSLYRTMNNGTDITVWAFSRTGQSWSNIGNVTNITVAGDRTIGANYADPDGHLYASSNGTGNVWRIDLDPFSSTAVRLGTGNPSSSNDGARCALAAVPIDAGDAPSSYDTTFEDDGPRHNVIGFNDSDSTGSMMLGTKVDIEDNGFPGAAADGDDNDHESSPGFVDDERGVQHIIATPGSSDPLTVPVYVTNNSTTESATLAGWIDLDNDGIFEIGEQVTASAAPGFSGYKQLTFPAPPAPYSINSYARFRLFSASDISDAAVGLLPTGSASGGEVEDVLVQVGSFSAGKNASPAEGTTVKSGQIVTYTLTITNTGSTPLTNLKIDDDLTDVLDDATLEGSPTVSPSSAGTATVTGNVLEFAGDINVGQSVTVTYKVKVEFLGSLGNGSLGNTIVAAHSNCNPDGDSSASVDDPACNTDHPVLGLAATGMSLPVVIGFAGGLMVISGAALLLLRRSKTT